MPTALIVAAVLAVAGAVVLTASAGEPRDYGVPSCAVDRLCDDSSQAIDALANGHVTEFFRHQPLMGPVSTVLRAPFAALAGSGRLARYRAGVAACLLALVAAAIVMALLAARAGRPPWIYVTAAAAMVALPISFRVVDWGHPEELLALALVLLALFAASAERPGLAGLAAGLAVACKLWALAAVPVVFVLLVVHRRRALAIAAAVLLLAYAPLAAFGTHAFRTTTASLGMIGWKAGTVSVANVWFPFASTVTFSPPIGFDTHGRLLRTSATGYQLPRAVGRLAHLLVLLVGLGLALWWGRRGRPDGLGGALLVVALALLLRCLLDPGTFSYYHAGFLIALVARDAIALVTPWLALTAVASFELLNAWAPHAGSPHTFNAVYLVWGLGLTALLAAVLTRSASRATKQAAISIRQPDVSAS